MPARKAVGLPRTAARFLDLPFYRTGEVHKHPIGEADVAIVRRLLEEGRPDTVFVAADLSDPHGTHRMGNQAIDRALAPLPASVSHPEAGLECVASQWPFGPRAQRP